MPHIIAIDGPSASGKSSTGAAVARALGFAHLDSGALYRGMALVALRDCGARPGTPLDPAALVAAAERRGLALHFDGQDYAVYLQGEPVNEAIRSPEVTALVSAVAALPEVRDWVNRRLRALARAGHSLVVDGRDIGTVVFPDADLKIFLTASPETRAERRLRQRGEPVDPAVLRREAARLAERDRLDAERPIAPLRMAPDAIALDGTALSFEQQVERIVALARQRLR
ncbi:MAG TPA: (d)CMP kinase [Gemmatimonadales bacterium]|jgi:cytidylate kinase|nr:(d)CMP kinase [Gemmatimonadales bacterium]